MITPKIKSKTKTIQRNHCMLCRREKILIRCLSLYLCRQCFRDSAIKLGFNKK